MFRLRSPRVGSDGKRYALRKWGTYEDWLHDSAIVEGHGRRYVLVGLTHHPQGEAYLEELARAIDELM
jgi:hypothetical protein